MSLARREQRALRRIDRALGRSDPDTQAEFWTFSKACAGQPMPGCERIRIRRAERWAARRRPAYR